MEGHNEEIVEIKKDIKKMEGVMQEVHSALIGNPITKDGGLVYRVIDGEVQLQRLESRVNEMEEKQNIKIMKLEKENDKTAIYVGIIWACGGALLAAIMIAIINHFTK